MDVAAWLRGLGLEQYAPVFRDNDVDGEVLPELTADDLIGLGVTSRRLYASSGDLLGQRKPSDEAVEQRAVPGEPQLAPRPGVRLSPLGLINTGPRARDSMEAYGPRPPHLDCNRSRR